MDKKNINGMSSYTKSQIVLNDLRSEGIECIELCALKDDKPMVIARIDHRINKNLIDDEDISNAYRLMTLWNDADEKEINTEDLDAKIQFLIEKNELEKNELFISLEALYNFLDSSFRNGAIPISEDVFVMMRTACSLIDKYKY
ncbi:MAG: hypothetical protein PHT94_00570 [Candidatus Nanoarchaeia archaeon]|nr:hypothetical protein [Candidatus Nanoarchaeia archaeon]